MAKAKHYVFSARTTEEGLSILNGIRAERKIGWDDLIIDAVNAHYRVGVPRPPKAERPKKEPKPKAEKKAKKLKAVKANASPEGKTMAGARAETAKVKD